MEGIKSIVSLKYSASSSPNVINFNNELTSDPLKMFSITILVQLEKKLYQKQGFQIKITLTIFMVKILILFFITPTDSQEVIAIISSLSDNKSSGPNSIPTRVLKLLKKDISTQLVDNFNLSFSSGIYPTPLKTAKVIPIHKKD